MTSVVNNSALEIALFALFLLVVLQAVDCKVTLTVGVQLGFIVGLGLLTRISFLISLPILGLLMLWHMGTHVSDRSWGRMILLWVIVAGLSVLPSSWWYLDKIPGAGRVLVDTFRAGAPTHDIPLVPYLVRYGWLTIYRNVLRMYWGNFGWLDTPIPDSLGTILSLLTVIASWSCGWWLVRNAMAWRDRESRATVFKFALLGLATLALVAFYTYLDYRFVRREGRGFHIQGRYFLPPIAGQMAWMLLGLSVAVPLRLQKLWRWLMGVGMVTLNGYALYGVIVPRYYPAKTLTDFLQQAALLQPIGPGGLKALMIAQFLAIGLLLVALWRQEHSALVSSSPSDDRHSTFAPN